MVFTCTVRRCYKVGLVLLQTGREDGSRTGREIGRCRQAGVPWPLTKRVAGRSISRLVRQERRTQLQSGRPIDRQNDVPIDKQVDPPTDRQDVWL
jgi:hypothetical protein